MKRIFTSILTMASVVLLTVQCISPKGADLYGKITDQAGNPIEGVVVSDGFSCNATDHRGVYRLNRHADASLVFYSTPSEYEINLKDGCPHFYTTLSDEQKRYDFTLTALPEGKEQSFRLFCISDPQCQTERHLERLRTESMPDIKRAAAEKETPCYGVTLGDIAYSSDKIDASWTMPKIAEAMSVENSGMPIFQCMGNHDNSPLPADIDENNSTINLKFRKSFEAAFGPADYSWNRGDVHLITMKNVRYNNPAKSSKYVAGFSPEQLEWLKQDLSYVDRDKMVILAVHIPIYSRKEELCGEVLELLGEFKDAHIVCGHTHYGRNYIHPNGVYEHILPALSGAWWISKLNGDGAPNGYGIFEIEGNKMKNWHYRGVGLDADYQMRLYRGNQTFGGEYEKFKLNMGKEWLFANIWNADKDWKIEVYEDGKLSGEMELIHITSGVETPSLTSSKDWWTVGLHIGVLGRGHTGGSSKLAGGKRRSAMTTNNHMYKFKLRNPNAKVKVVATDRFGNIYEEDKLATTEDYTNFLSPI